MGQLFREDLEDLIAAVWTNTSHYADKYAGKEYRGSFANKKAFVCSKKQPSPGKVNQFYHVAEEVSIQI